MIDLRLRSQRTDHDVEKMAGRLLSDNERSLDLTGPATVRKPNGQLLCIYLPGVLSDLVDEQWDVLSSIRADTSNRGHASASDRIERAVGSRSDANKVASAILGSFDQTGGPLSGTCRLTALTVKNYAKMEAITPLLQRMDNLFREHVGDRYEAQREYANRTEPEWLIPGTVYTTVTVNNTYPTGVHTDKGDLDAGFSCLAVARRGAWSGGVLTFPKYGVGVSMRNGDLILMDAHEHHGNTPIRCDHCGESLRRYGHVCGGSEPPPRVKPERVSVVAYYRTKIEQCDTAEGEASKRVAKRERRNQANLA